MLTTLTPTDAHAPDAIAVRAIGRGNTSADRAAAALRAATRRYEQHVIAWYALGRVSEARAARDAIARCRRTLAAELRNASNAPAFTSAAPQTMTGGLVTTNTL
jgi:hypothetical protein